MAIVQIVITEDQGHYHAPDVIVKVDDTVEITTDISGANFMVGFNNTDNFFTNLVANSLSVGSAALPLTVGDVTSKGANVNYYKISDPNNIIPGIDAPPRIIRVA